MWILTDKGRRIMQEAEAYVVENLLDPPRERVIESRRYRFLILNSIDKTGKLPNWKYKALENEGYIVDV